MEDEKKSLRRLWQQLSERERRRLLGLGLCLVLGVMLLSWSSPDGRSRPVEAENAAAASLSQNESEDRLEDRLEEILCQVKGAGRVRVAVWYSSGAAAVYATESQESSERRQGESDDQQSSETKVTVAAVGDQPVLVRQDAACVRGVLVVAEGAGDPLVRERLYGAVKSLLGLKSTQIAVIEGEGSDLL